MCWRPTPLEKRSLFVFSSSAILSYAGLDFLRQSSDTTRFLQVDKMWWYAAIPACGTLMCIYSAVALSRTVRGQIDMPREIATLG